MQDRRQKGKKRSSFHDAIKLLFTEATTLEYENKSERLEHKREFCNNQ